MSMSPRAVSIAYLVSLLFVVLATGCKPSRPRLSHFSDKAVRNDFWVFVNDRHAKLKERYRQLKFVWRDTQRATGTQKGGIVSSTYDLQTQVMIDNDFYLLERTIPQTTRSYVFGANRNYAFTVMATDGNTWRLVEISTPDKIIKPFDEIYGTILSLQHRLEQHIESESVLFVSFAQSDFGGQPCFRLEVKSVDEPAGTYEWFFSSGPYGECLAQKATFEDGTSQTVNFTYDRSHGFPLVQTIEYNRTHSTRTIHFSDYVFGRPSSHDKCYLTYFQLPEPDTNKSPWWQVYRLQLSGLGLVMGIAIWWILKKRKT